jgi:hypothetical protein
MIAAIGGVVALLVGMVSRRRGRKPGVVLGNGKKLGRAPYAQVETPPIEMSLQKLANFTRDLRNSPAAANLKVDWTEYDRYCQDAVRAQPIRPSEAMQTYARALRTLMQSIRDAQAAEASDSNIEL